jgi:ATP-binding cassette subfamily B protein
LLLVFWAMSIPALGQDIGTLIRGVPALRNTLLRFLELINAPQQEIPAAAAARPGRGVKIGFEAVSVVVAGHTVLENICLEILPGEHVGIIGISGAGKSTLVGCLLGWYQPAAGSIRVDDVPLDAAGLYRLRRHTAWIDPQVHLFGDSLYANLHYGNETASGLSIEDTLKIGDLERILSRSPDGLQMALGEGGTLVSGGEGQRIRAARALRRAHVELAVLDEPARGLGREQRRRLLVEARRRFAAATLFCVTHDVSDTLDFDRVLVVEHGRLIEQGPPQLLRTRDGSRYAQLLDEEAAVAHDLWGDPVWRRLRLQAGVLSEVPAQVSLRERYRA